MLFQTPEFGLLFAATLIAFYLLARSHRLQVLALASLTFYAASGLLDFMLLVGTILLTYALSKRVNPHRGKWPIYVAVVLLIGSLAYFKYGDFAYQNLRVALGGATWLDRPGFLATILPLGISFYTFQIVSYFIDLYRDRTERAESLLQFTVFVTLFAQLIAGPIMKGRDFLPQISALRGATGPEFRAGALLVLVGLFKKVVLADSIAQRVDARFAAASFTQPEAWIASALFAFQIYFDFSGYVDIALGLGKMVGFKLTENFMTPYLARNASEFWGRWHITLSNWFREYLYIPLGGNRLGRWREVFNLMLVMGIAGLWHGAGWTFVLWGLIHGFYLAVQRFLPSQQLQALLPVPNKYKSYAYQAIGIAVMFNLIVLAWIPFRAEDLPTTMDMFGAIVSFEGAGGWVSEAPWLGVVGFLFGLHVLERLVKENRSKSLEFWSYVPPVGRGVAYAGLVLLVLAFAESNQSFIYFRF
ncbi:MAG TPA: MBOAT family O-acyltransferase [Dehalococcoidia bacterium]|nr:MBOAT family O-acyltransferase [Dehalococcoidia bacterium]